MFPHGVGYGICWDRAVVWMCVLPQNSYVEILIPDMMTLGDEVFLWVKQGISGLIDKTLKS